MKRAFIFTICLSFALHVSLFAQKPNEETNPDSIEWLASQNLRSYVPIASLSKLGQEATNENNTVLFFQGKDSRKGIELKWSTILLSKEVRIMVERSWDGENYRVIGEVLGLREIREENGQGFLDKYPRPGVNYYRLWILDEENKEHLSDSIMIERAGT